MFSPPGFGWRDAQSRVRMRDILTQTDCVGQLLLTAPREDGSFQTCMRVMPILKVTKLRLMGEAPHAVLTCIGRGRVDLPLIRSSEGHAFAKMEPMEDDYSYCRPEDYPESSLSLRSRYNSCRELSACARRAESGLSLGGMAVAEMFDRPLETLLQEREHILCDALMGACDREIQFHTAAGEGLPQLLSFAVASLLAPERRVEALDIVEPKKRQVFVGRALKELEQRLTAELALQEWDETR